MLFSIITVNYNDVEGLKKTLSSVKSQRCTDYEHIIIDGGSTDGSLEFLNANSGYFSFWQSKPDRGIYDAMNIGIKYAKGRYLNFMNSGDTFHSPDTLKIISKKANNFDMIVGNSYMPEIKTYNINQYKKFTLLTLLKHPLNHQSIFYKKNLFDNYCYDISLKMMADFKFNIQSIVINNCSVNIIDDVVCDFDVNGLSSKKSTEYYSTELYKILNNFFPARILADYELMFTPEEMPIIRLLPRLRKTKRLQYLVYLFAKLLLKIKR